MSCKNASMTIMITHNRDTVKIKSLKIAQWTLYVYIYIALINTEKDLHRIASIQSTLMISSYQPLSLHAGGLYSVDYVVFSMLFLHSNVNPLTTLLLHHPTTV